MATPNTYELTRFFSRVEVDERGCWVWRGAVNHGGYAVFLGGENAHRTAYRWFVGVIPPLHHIDHLCRNTVCVNPAHLEAVTQQENQRRASVFVVNGACKRGHPATTENIIVLKSSNGRLWRTCKQCRRASQRRYAEKHHVA